MYGLFNPGPDRGRLDGGRGRAGAGAREQAGRGGDRGGHGAGRAQTAVRRPSAGAKTQAEEAETMSDPQAALSRAQDVLADALDTARKIANNPNAGAQPREVAEAVLEASPLVDEALDGWPEAPDEGPPDEGDGQTYSVANDAELASAMDRARPGDAIDLAAGSYATTRLKGLGVTFRGAPPLGAVFTKTVAVDVEGEDVRLDGLAFANGLRLGDDTVATGCTIGAKSDDVMACLELAGV